MKIVVALIAACGLVASMGTAAQAASTVKVGSTVSGQPTSGLNPQTKQWEGVAVELMMAVAKDAGLQLEFVPMVFAELQPALLDKKIDVIASGFGITPARQKVVAFTEPYWTFRDLLVVPTTDARVYRSAADFKGMSIATPKGSAYAAGLQKAGANITFVASPPEAIRALEEGRVAGVVDNGLQVAYRLRGNANPRLKIVDSYPPIQEVQLAFAVRKDDVDLLAKLDASLAKLQASGAVREIAAKWSLRGPT